MIGSEIVPPPVRVPPVMFNGPTRPCKMLGTTSRPPKRLYVPLDPVLLPRYKAVRDRIRAARLREDAATE